MSTKAQKAIQAFPLGLCLGNVTSTLTAQGPLQLFQIRTTYLGTTLLRFDGVCPRTVQVAALGEGKTSRRVLPKLVLAGTHACTLRSRLHWSQLPIKGSLFLEVTLPRDVPLDIHAEFWAGVLLVKGGRANLRSLRVKGTAGEVAADGYTASRTMDITLRCGRVALDNATGPATIQVGCGSVDLAWPPGESSSMYKAKQVSVDVKVGSVEYTGPFGVAEAQQLTGNHVAQEINIGSGNDIFLKTGIGLGNLRVRHI